MINLITGIIGQSLFILCVLPQLIKTLKTKNVNGLSTHMWWLYILAEAFSIVYFATLTMVPVIALLQCIISLILCIWQLKLIYKYRGEHE